MTEYGSVLDGYIVPGEPLVSVNVITYNHGKYIRQCLDGILMQKVNFPYEVLVHDDASPDDTADIIREYEARFPTVIKPIYQTENQCSQGKDVSKFNIDRAKGKYIAQCEGDDYWTDSEKLQMQVDFLEEHPDYVETGHNIHVLTERGFLPTHPESHINERTYTLDDLKKGKFNHIATASAVYRNIFQQLDEDTLNAYYSCKANGDLKIQCLLPQYGKVYRFKKCMSVYRYIASGSISYNSLHKDENMTLSDLQMFHCVEEYVLNSFGVYIDFKPIYMHIIYRSIYEFFKRKKYLEDLKIFKILSRDYISRYKTMSYLFLIYIYVPLRIYQGVINTISQRLFVIPNHGT